MSAISKRFIMQIMEPSTVLDANYTSCTISENQNDPNPATVTPVWQSGGSYAVGAKVIHSNDHVIYECVLATGAGTTAPPQNPTCWHATYAVNKWRIFDGLNTEKDKTFTLTGGKNYKGADGFGFVLNFTETINCIGFFGQENVTKIEIEYKNNLGEVVFSESTDMLLPPATSTHYDWFFGRQKYRKKVFYMLPAYSSCTITVNVYGVSAKIGEVACGYMNNIGNSINRDSPFSITDYSKLIYNDMGYLTRYPGNYAQRTTWSTWIQKNDTDFVHDLLTSLKGARHTIFLGYYDVETKSIPYEIMLIYGICKHFEIKPNATDKSDLSIEIEGGVSS